MVRELLVLQLSLSQLFTTTSQEWEVSQRSRPTGSVLRVLDVLLSFVPTVCYAYFVGVIAWKVCVTSCFFQSFPDWYAVTPRFLHPDGACGLLPVGDLCLTMIYVAVIPTALSALFPLAHFAPQGFAVYLTPNDTLLFGFTPVILGVGALGLIVGFLPLYRFHLAIIKHRDEWTQELKGLAERIIAEKAKIFRPPEGVGEPPIDAVLKTVTDLQSHYEASPVGSGCGPSTVDLLRESGARPLW